MPPHSRTSPLTAGSRASPYQMGRTITHQRRLCISLPNLHSGQVPGHSSRSLSLFIPFSCIAFPSCFLLLSFISLVPFCNSRLPASHKSDPTLSQFDPSLVAPSDPRRRHCYCFQIASPPSTVSYIRLQCFLLCDTLS